MKQISFDTILQERTDHLQESNEATHIFESVSEKRNGQGMVEKLPGLIFRKLALMGFDEKDLEHAEELIDSIRRIYDRMGLIDANYHNHAHNLSTAFAMLLLIEDIQDTLSKNMKKSVFVAALMHDFHVREKSFNGKQTAALVEETIRELSDMLGIRGGKYPGKATDNARYTDAKFRAAIEITKRVLQNFLGNIDEKTYRIIMALIRRTDFASDTDSPSPSYRETASEIRSGIIDSRLREQESKGAVNEVQLTKLSVDVEVAFERNIFSLLAAAREHVNRKKTAEIETNRKWAVRRKAIETAYLRSLLFLSRIAPDVVPIVHTLACRLEKGADQAGFYWMSSPEMIEDTVLPGLDKEMPFSVTDASTYLFFFKNELLPRKVIEILALLPNRYKTNFLTVMRHFSKLSTQAGWKIRWSDKTFVYKQALLSSERHWRDREYGIAAAFGLKSRGSETLRTCTA